MPIRNRGGTLPRLGALARWRAEVHAGGRQNTAADFDALHAAACEELAALECEALGDHGKARMFMDRALLRLNGCYQNPEDGEGFHAIADRLLQELKAKAGAA